MKKILGIAMLVFLTACSDISPTTRSGLSAEHLYNPDRPGFEVEVFQSPNLTRATQRAIMDMQRAFPGMRKSGRKVFVANFTDFHAFKHSRSIGRAVSQEMTKQLNSRSWTAENMRLTDDMYRPTADGFMSVSSEALLYAKRKGKQVLMTGTTEVVAGDVVVRTQLIRVSDGGILAQYSYTIPSDDALAKFVNRP